MGENLEFNDMSWCERILFIMEPDRWYSRRQIKDALGLDYSVERFKCSSVGAYLLRLVKAGYIIRADAPEQIKGIPLRDVKYVYKVRRKSFRINSRMHRYYLSMGRTRRQKNASP